MSDQAQGQSEQPSIKDQIGALLSPPEPEQTIEQPVVEVPQEGEVPQTAETQAEVPETDPTANWEEVEVNGVRVQVPPEVAKGVMQERDYTQKTQALADERRAVEANRQAVQIQQAAMAQVQPLVTAVMQIDQQMQAYQRIDWDTLRANDPLDYSTKRADYAALAQHRQEVTNRLNQAGAYFDQQAKIAIARAAAAAAPAIKRLVPDWSPEKVSTLEKYAVKEGYTPHELLQMSSRPHAVSTLEKARKWDELQAKTAQLPKKVSGLSPVAKPGARAADPQQASFRTAIERVKTSGGKDKNAIRAAIAAKLKG